MRKISRKVLTSVSVIGVSLSALAGCSSGGEDAPASGASADGGAKRIGVALVYKGDEWTAAVAEDFATQGAELGWDMNLQDGNLNNETQIKQIENFVAQQVDMIMVDAADADGILPAIQKAKDANIPVIAFDSKTNSEDLVSYVSWDSKETGTVLGTYLKEEVIPEYGRAVNIAVLTMNSPPAILDRVTGFKEALEGVDVQYIAEQDYQGNREKASTIISNIKEPFDIVVAGQDNGAWGAVSALEALNKPDVKVYSFGAFGDEPFNALKANDSNYKGTVAISPSILVTTVMDTAVAYFEGEREFPAVQNIPLDLVNADNIEDYLSGTSK